MGLPEQLRLLPSLCSTNRLLKTAPTQLTKNTDQLDWCHPRAFTPKGYQILVEDVTLHSTKENDKLDSATNLPIYDSILPAMYASAMVVQTTIGLVVKQYLRFGLKLTL